MSRLSRSGIAAAILLGGGILALTVRSRADAADGTFSASDSVMIVVVTTAVTLLVVSLWIARSAGPNRARQAFLRGRFPDARVEVVRLHDDLLAGLGLLAGTNASDIARVGGAHFVSVVVEQHGLSVWSGISPAVQVIRLQWHQLGRAAPGAWVADGREFECVVVEVMSEERAIKLPLELFGRGPGGLFPKTRDEMAQFSKEVTAKLTA